MDLAGTRDILSHSGTVPDNPGHLVTLVLEQTERFAEDNFGSLKEKRGICHASKCVFIVSLRLVIS